MSDSSGPLKKLSNFVVRILGNDFNNHHEDLLIHSKPAQPRRIPSQFSIWLSALQHMKLSKALDGVQLSNNMGVLMVYLFMAFWLCVVYQIRHHDPLAKPIATAASTTSGAAEAQSRPFANAESGPFADPRFGSPSSPLVQNLPQNLSGSLSQNVQIQPGSLGAPLYRTTSLSNEQFDNAPLPSTGSVLTRSAFSSSSTGQGPIVFGPSRDGSRLKLFVSR